MIAPKTRKTSTMRIPNPIVVAIFGERDTPENISARWQDENSQLRKLAMELCSKILWFGKSRILVIKVFSSNFIGKFLQNYI